MNETTEPNEFLEMECEPVRQDGLRTVAAIWGDRVHRGDINTSDKLSRTRFAEEVLAAFGQSLTADLLEEFDKVLVDSAAAKDNRPQVAPISGGRLVCVADVERASVAWLWPGRIPLGKVTLLAGDPGLGKSMLTLDIAARVSRGARWPDEEKGEGGWRIGEGDPLNREPASVLLLSAEDDLADTIRPRLEAHGADCRRVLALQADGVWGDGRGDERSFDLSRDIAYLTGAIASLENCRLVVIDPISAYLGRGVENANAEVRALLRPLAKLAAERHLAVVLVTHLRKEDGAAVHRTMGSLAFVAAARSAWVVCRDPSDPQQRLFLPLKNNLAESTGGLAYTTETMGPSGIAAIRWSDEVISYGPDNSLRGVRRRPGPPADEREAVRDWLRQFLAMGPRATAEVREHALAHGFSNTTLRRAFRELDGRADRDCAGRWRWAIGAGDEKTPRQADEAPPEKQLTSVPT